MGAPNILSPNTAHSLSNLPSPNWGFHSPSPTGSKCVLIHKILKFQQFWSLFLICFPTDIPIIWPGLFPNTRSSLVLSLVEQSTYCFKKPSWMHLINSAPSKPHAPRKAQGKLNSPSATSLLLQHFSKICLPTCSSPAGYWETDSLTQEGLHLSYFWVLSILFLWISSPVCSFWVQPCHSLIINATPSITLSFMSVMLKLNTAHPAPLSTKYLLYQWDQAWTRQPV